MINWIISFDEIIHQIQTPKSLKNRVKILENYLAFIGRNYKGMESNIRFKGGTRGHWKINTGQ